MNRRDKQRMDDRRREANTAKRNNHDLNSSDSSKTLMDNYFQSQKVIQSLTDGLPAVNEIAAAKPFKIPKKQPANNVAGHCNSGSEKIRGTDERNQQHNNRTTSDSRQNSTWNSHNERTEQNRRFDAERRQGDQVRPKKDFHERRSNEPNRIELEQSRRREDRSPANRNERTPRNFEERRKRDGVFVKQETFDSKRTRLDIPIPSNRFGKRKPEVKPNEGYSTMEKIRLNNRLYFNQPIDIIIADRAAPSGKISPENAEIFLNTIKESVAQRIHTDPINQTKFISHRHEDGLITMTCADDFTSVFIQQKLTEDLSLWPGAKLEWSFGHFKSCFIILIIPNSIGHISEFLDICKKTDSRMQTDKWRRIDCEVADDESGKLFKLAIDKQSYEIIKQQGNVIRCGDLSIKIEWDSTLNEIAEELRQSK